MRRYCELKLASRAISTRVEAGTRCKEAFGGLLYRREDLDDFVHFGELEAVIDHGLRGGDAQRATRGLELLQAANDCTNSGTVGVSNSGHVEYHSRFA